MEESLKCDQAFEVASTTIESKEFNREKQDRL